MKIYEQLSQFIRKGRAFRLIALSFISITMCCAFSLEANVSYSKKITTQSTQSQTKENILFIDNNVLASETIHQSFENLENLNTFHLFSHGRDGELFLDNQWRNAEEIIAWFQNTNFLKSKTHLNIYGCEFAKGHKGKLAVQFLEKELGVSIAASNDITGKDGDWDLEIGQIKQTIAINEYAYNLQDCCNNTHSNGAGGHNHVKSLTLEYTGQSGNVTLDTDDNSGGTGQTSITKVVNNGDIVTFAAAGSKKYGSNSDWHYPGGSISLHTSCSQNDVVLGAIFGPFKILGIKTANGCEQGIQTTNPSCPTASNNTSTSSISVGQTKTLTGSPTGGTWSIVSGGGSISGSTYTPANVSSNTNVTIRYTIAASGNCPTSTDDQSFTVTTTTSSGQDCCNGTHSNGAGGHNHVKSLTLEYTGQSGNVTLDTDDNSGGTGQTSITKFVNNGEIVIFAAAGSKKYGSNSDWDYPGGSISLHTSCSQNDVVLNATFGPFKILGIETANGCMEGIQTICSNITNPGTISGGGTFCMSGNPTNITNTTSPSGGSGTLEYQWQFRNGTSGNWINISGATSATYNPPSITETRQYRRRAKRSNCTAWLNSNVVTATIIDNYSNGGTIAGNESECSSFNPVNITSSTTPSGGSGGTLEYQWQSRNASNSTWTDITGATSATYNPPSITETHDYRRRARRSPCTSWVNSNVVTKIVGQNFTDGGVIAGDEIDCNSYNPSNIISVSIPSGGSGGTIEYQWQFRTGTSGSWTIISGATNRSYNPPSVITQTQQYRRRARLATCTNWSPSNVVTKTIVTSNSPDKDNDGVVDICDLDDDNDGISDIDEGCNDALLNFPNADKGFLFQGTEVFTIDLQTGNSVKVADLLANYNAVTINEQTGKFWAINQTTNFVEVIDPTTFIATQTFSANTIIAISAAYDPIRKLYVANNGSSFKVVDADPNSATYGNRLYTFNNNANTQINDLAYNSVDGYMYGIRSGVLYQVDIAGQVVNNLGNVQGFSGGAGAAYSTNDGLMYFADNGTGNIYVMDLENTGNSVTLFSVGPASGNNDGAKALGVDLDGNPLCLDTDRDGIPNSCDPDSDNDGCPDAVEGGGMFNYQDIDGDLRLTGNVDNDGFPNQVNGNSQGIGTSTDAQTNACCDVSVSNAPDKDNDGVADSCDEDDDNDGISDIDEGCNDFIAAFPAAKNGYLFQNNPTEVYTLDISTGTPTHITTLPFKYNGVAINEADGFFWGFNRFNNRLTLLEPQNFNEVHTFGSFSNINAGAFDPINKLYVFSANSTSVYIVDADPNSANYGSLVNTIGLPFDVSDITYNSNNGLFYGIQNFSNNLIQINHIAGMTQSLGSVTNLPSGVYGAAYSTFDGNMYFGENGTGEIHLIDLSVGVSASLFTTGPSSNQNDGAKVLGVDLNGDPLCLDTDQDGIPNSCDLDSDNDGCPDAIEGGGNFTDTNLDSDDRLTGNVDNDGFPNQVNGNSQGVGTSIDPTTIACCNLGNAPDKDADGIADICDLDDDNDGISDIDEGCSNFSNFTNADKGFLFQGTEVFTVDIQTGNYLKVADLSTGYNAVTVNEETGMFWAINQSTNLLEVLNPNTFNVVNTFTSTINAISAAYDPMRKLYVANNGSSFKVVDADPTSSTYGNILHTFTTSTNINDLAYNSDDGYLYGIRNGILYQVNVTGQSINSLGNVNGFSGGAGAAYATYDGRMFFSENSSGNIYMMDLANTGNSVTLFSSGPPSGSNDGAKVLGVDLNGNPLCLDTDGDGIPNSCDPDSDNDGCFDAIEGSGSFASGDIDGNGRLTGGVDGDGFPNVVNGSSQGIGTSQDTTMQDVNCPNPCLPSPTNIDSDNDNIADICDLDDDNDGILDTDEGSGDFDNDGVPNSLDLDSDNDGCPDAIEGGGSFTNANLDGNDRLTGNVDADGLPNLLNGNSQSVGSSQNMAIQDANCPNPCLPSPTNIDSDNDNLADICDLDDDNDGILDTDEGSGDFDNDGIPNSLDLDSDNDGCPDAIEGGANFTSANLDGNDRLTGNVDVNGLPNLLNGNSQSVGSSQNMVIQDANCPNPCLPSPTNDNGNNNDNDNDNLADLCDLDDDNDGILDTEEGPGDFDNDGIPNSLDLDSDNDGCPDAIEGGANFTNIDLDANGRLTGGVDANGIPIVANPTGQTKGSSQNATTSTCSEICNNGIDDNGDGLIDCTDPDCGIVASVIASNETCSQNNGSITITFLDNLNQTDIEFSINGGSTWNYTTPDNAGVFNINNLSAGTYDLRARWDDNSCPVVINSNIVITNNGTQAACNPTVIFHKSVNADTVRMGETVVFTFTITNNSGANLNNVSFIDNLPNGGLFFSEPTQVTGGVQVSGQAMNTSSANLTLFNVPVGVSSFQLAVDIPLDLSQWSNYCNRARLENLKASNPNLPNGILSDDPSTSNIDDPTCVVVRKYENCCNGIDDDGDGLCDDDDPDCQH